MTKRLETLLAVASDYDAIVFDQWGVLHNGTAPYSGAVDCLKALAASNMRMAVLSNSGKRAAPNAKRIADMGFPESLFEFFMTSGEALWRDICAGHIPQKHFYAIERGAGDAALWAEGLDVEMTNSLDKAEAVLLMGLPDGSTLPAWEPVLIQALEKSLPIYCSNPDRSSPRGDGYVISPGALAFHYRDLNGDVRFYGKPHRPVFDALEEALGTKKLLMVGDSIEHDIAGANGAGWDSLLIEGGLYAQEFAADPSDKTLDRLVAEKKTAPPTYRIRGLQ